MKDFFLGQTHVDLINVDEALSIYESLKKAGFNKSCHIKTQEAVAQHNRRGIYSVLFAIVLSLLSKMFLCTVSLLSQHCFPGVNFTANGDASVILKDVSVN